MVVVEKKLKIKELFRGLHIPDSRIYQAIVDNHFLARNFPIDQAKYPNRKQAASIFLSSIDEDEKISALQAWNYFSRLEVAAASTAEEALLAYRQAPRHSRIENIAVTKLFFLLRSQNKIDCDDNG